MPEHAVLKEKVRRLQEDLRKLEEEVRRHDTNLDGLNTAKETILIQLGHLQQELGTVSTTISKDAGWRGFFIDFIKASAQIAAMVGAGKMIF